MRSLIGLSILILVGCRGGGGRPDDSDGGMPGDGGIVDAGPDATPDAGHEVEHFFRGIELTDYETIPALGALDVTTFEMRPSLTYWELRYSDMGRIRTVLRAPWNGSGPCGEASDSNACFMAWRALAPSEGFGPGCEPVRCYYFLATNAGDRVEAVTSHEAFVEGLGEVESAAEAALVVLAHGYRWDPDPDNLRDGAMRAVEGGWEFIVWDVAGDERCDGLRTAHFLVEVADDGSLRVRRSGQRSCEPGVHI